MKATIDKDIIVVLGRGDVDIPDDFPRGVGLERLRWTGEAVVDLADLSEFWVEPLKDGAYRLHAIEVPGSYLVSMAYADRKRLAFNPHPRVLTQEEIDSLRQEKAIKAAKEELSKLFKKQVGTIDEMLIVLIAVICGLIIYVRTGSPAIQEKIDTMLPDLQNLPLLKMLSYSPNAFKSIKTILEIYFNRVGV